MYRKRGVLPRFQTGAMVIKRKWWSAAWVPTTATTNDFWRPLFISLSNIPNYTDFTNMFDQYKICAFKVTYFPKYTGFGGENTTDTTLPGITNTGQNIMHVCYDTRTTVTPSGTYTSATLNNFFEQGRIKTIRNGNAPINIYCRPSIQGNYIGGTATNMYTGPKWLPTSSATLNHYGPNVFVQDANLAGVFGQQYDVLITAYIAVKNQK